MATLNLTQRGIEALKNPDSARIDYWDGTLKNFGLRVTADGRKTFIVRYRASGRRRRITVGTYPLMSLADARESAKKILGGVQLGIDPGAKKEEFRKSATFEELSTDFLENYAWLNKKESSVREDKRMLEKEVLPAFGRLKVLEVSKQDVKRLLAATVKRGAPVHANRLYSLIRKIFNFGISEEYLTANPCEGMQRPLKDEPSRERVLRPGEIRSIWLALDKVSPMWAAYFRLLLLTGQRGGEVRLMEWKDLDFETSLWEIPAEKTKNGKPHSVYLSPQARQVISTLRKNEKTDFVFADERKKIPQPIQTHHKVLKVIKAESGVDFWPHDFRRTCATNLAALGFEWKLIQQILNHSDTRKSATDAYVRHSYGPEKQEALRIWGLRIVEVVKVSIG